MPFHTTLGVGPEDVIRGRFLSWNPAPQPELLIIPLQEALPRPLPVEPVLQEPHLLPTRAEASHAEQRADLRDPGVVFVGVNEHGWIVYEAHRWSA